MIVCLVVATTDILLLGVLLYFENKKRDRREVVVGAEDEDRDGNESREGELLDITDFQNREFRYVF